MQFEQFSQGDSFLHRLHPGVKCAGALALTMVLALSTHVITALSGLLVGVLLVLLAGLPMGLVGRRVLVVNGFILFLWFTLPLTYPGSPLLSYGMFSISREGVMLSGLITIKANAILLLLIALPATSSIAELGRGLEFLRVPAKLRILLLFSYRYIFVINHEYQRLLRAAKLRGFTARTSMHTYRTFAYLFGMTLVKSHHRATRVYEAMVLRGFTGRFHSLHASAPRPVDMLWLAALAAAAAGLTAMEIYNG
jgi:cobalt/nickel transport system permease protein